MQPLQKRSLKYGSMALTIAITKMDLIPIFPIAIAATCDIAIIFAIAIAVCALTGGGGH